MPISNVGGMPRFAMGYAALKNYFSAEKPSEYRLVDKEEATETESNRNEWYEIQKLQFLDGVCKWICIAQTQGYDSACAVYAIESAREPVGTVVSTSGIHREVLGWRVLRVQKRRYIETTVRQMKSEVILPPNVKKGEAVK